MDFTSSSWIELEAKSGRAARRLSRLLAVAGGKNPGLDFQIAVQKHGIVRHRLLDELLDQEQLGAVDDGVDALLKGLHRREGLERFPEEDDGRMPALTHGHVLEG